MRTHAVRLSRHWRGQRSSPVPSFRPLSTTSTQLANALPITATGPPPEPPTPASGPYSDKVTERRRKAALLQAGKDLRAAEAASSQSPGKGKKPSSSPLKRRFWKDVHIRESPAGGFEVHLDARPVRTPSKTILTIPKSKPHLAHAIAIEWDMLESAQQALKNHNIPMTSTAARAQDIAEAEAKGDHTIRNQIINVMIGYLDTDTLLCWAPEQDGDDTGPLDTQTETKKETLRQRQIRIATPILAFLNTSVWPGVEIKPVLDEGSIMPVKQSEVTRSVIQGWIAGLPAFEVAALERAVLATKSLLVGTRLLIEWSEEFRDLQRGGPDDARFGIEEAAEAATLEVRWQTAMWGEVEDTHDVDHEDIRRQLGSAILLVSGGR